MFKVPKKVCRCSHFSQNVCMKDLNPSFEVPMWKVQEAGSVLREFFALLKSPHLHRAYLVTVCNRTSISVHIYFLYLFKFNLIEVLFQFRVKYVSFGFETPNYMLLITHFVYSCLTICLSGTAGFLREILKTMELYKWMPKGYLSRNRIMCQTPPKSIQLPPILGT